MIQSSVSTAIKNTKKILHFFEGTTYSGYAYSFTADPDDINIMRKWEGDDPGKNNLQKYFSTV